MAESLAERVVRLETEVSQLTKLLEEHQTQTKEMNEKLDTLLTLRHKGVGAFWLASGLMGTGIFGFFTWLVDAIKHG
jgi:hypothetical protein